MFELPSQTIFYQIEKSIKAYRRLAQSRITEQFEDLTLDQTLLLIAIQENPQLSLTEQAELLFKENSSITRMIEALTQKEYLSRAFNLEDKRKFHLSLTPKGEKALQELRATIESNRRKALAGISKDNLNQMKTTLTQIIKNCQIVLVMCAGLVAINPSGAQDMLSEEEKTELISSVTQILLDNYVFPEVATEIGELLSQQQAKGAYQEVNDPMVLAKLLTADIQSVNHDKHLRVLHEPERIKRQQLGISAEDSLKSLIDRQNRLKTANYGFQEVKILKGNVGYLDLRGFFEPEVAGTTADAAITFLSNADAIIIDLTQNGGGTPKMVQWIISYFFEGDPFLLNSFYKREGDYAKQFWTMPHPQTERLSDVKLYVLTSNYTFSAAEEFAYDLKHLNRATIVGETTGGGAHPGGRIKASSKFNVWTPTARAINPVTQTNWEGKGVIPHLDVPKEEALDVAYLRALKELMEENEDYDYEKLIQSLESK